jgi:hypothetical protein
MSRGDDGRVGKLASREAGKRGVISPLLSNIYLHEVLDEWFEKEVRPRLAGQGALIRYADDCAPRDTLHL